MKHVSYHLKREIPAMDNPMEENLKLSLEMINRDGFVSVKDLTRKLGVTRGTTDRYLQRLEENHQIKRVQGGAVSLHKDFEFCPNYYYSDFDNHFQERALIAQKAVEMINWKDCVFLGGGRDTLHVAKELKLQEKKVTIVTNSLHVALLLAGTCHVNIVGVMPTTNEGILIGAAGDDLFVNKAIIAPGSVTDDGFYNATPLIIQLESSFVKKAKETIILADSEAYASYKPYKMCSYNEVSAIVTIKAAPAFIRKDNVKVYYV